MYSSAMRLVDRFVYKLEVSCVAYPSIRLYRSIMIWLPWSLRSIVVFFARCSFDWLIDWLADSLCFTFEFFDWFASFAGLIDPSIHDYFSTALIDWFSYIFPVRCSVDWFIWFSRIFALLYVLIYRQRVTLSVTSSPPPTDFENWGVKTFLSTSWVE